MTNHSPVFTSSSATGSFSENTNTTGSSALHTLTGTMNFTDSDHSDTHTTSATLKSATVSGGTIIPGSSLSHFQAAMTSQKISDSNGSGKIKWTFNDADNDFDFLARNQTLVLTYDIKVFDNHGGSAIQTVKITVTGTDDKPVITATAVATVTEQANKTLSFSMDTVHVALAFTDVDLANTGHTATVLSASATGNTSGIIFGNAQLMAYFDVDNVVKNNGSGNGVINTTFSAPDLSFDYLADGETLNITYVVQLDDHAGGISTQNVQVTVVGTNDAPFYICGPQTEHLIEGQNVNSSGNLHADGDLLFTDIDLSDAHTVSTTVTATRSGGGAVPLTNAQLIAALNTSLTPDSTGHLIGDVDWNFMLNNNAVSFLNSGETLTLVYHVAINDSSASDSQDVTITILGTNDPVIITSGPESASVFELADTTGSAAIDTTTTVPAGTLDFTDTDIGDTHTVTTTLLSTSGGPVPAATQADLAAAISTTLHDSTGTGTGSVDWNFNIADQDLDYLAEGETLTVNYNVKVSDASTNDNQTVSVTVTGANDAPEITSGPGSASLAEQPNTTGSSALDTTSPVPTGTLSFTDVDLSDVHSVNVSIASAIWSGNPDFVPADIYADLQTALATTLHDSTSSGSGGVDWTFSIQDKDLDFLAAGETLTVTYNVAVSDATSSSTQSVTITITGAEDNQLIVNPLTATLADTGVLDDGQIVASGNLISDAADSGGDFSNALAVTEVNGQAFTGSLDVVGTYGTLTVDSSGIYFYVANSSLDPLQVGDNATEQFDFTVTDSFGHSVATTLTFNVMGANDSPSITAAATTASMTEDAGPTVIVNGGFESGDLTGWTGGTHVQVQQYEIGGAFGHFTTQLGNTQTFITLDDGTIVGITATETLAQNVATTQGQHYSVSFSLAGDDEGSGSVTVTWGDKTLLTLSNVPGGFITYSFDHALDGSELVGGEGFSTALHFSYADDGVGMLLDEVSVNAATGPATETADGTIAFADVETGDTHTASFVPNESGYVGTFSLDDSVTESPGSGSVGWHFTVNNADIQFLSLGQTLTQTYTVNVADNHGGTVAQDVTVTIAGANDAPTAVAQTIVTDVDTGGLVRIPGWALAANASDPDTADTHSFVSAGAGSGGTADSFSGNAFFTDDGTLGGSFTYRVTDGSAQSAPAVASVVNNATTTTALVGTGGDDIIIATNGTESLSGGGGNDVLIGNDGAHTMTGGSGNDNFAFLQPSNGVGTITDFNNTSQHDHIAISASGYGGGLTAGMDVTSIFETSADDQFSGFAEFHFDTANQTLYYSADGTQASAITIAQVQAGVTINPHDLLIV
jgi:VCBS repeat-containing protein